MANEFNASFPLRNKLADPAWTVPGHVAVGDWAYAANSTRNTIATAEYLKGAIPVSRDRRERWIVFQKKVRSPAEFGMRHTEGMFPRMHNRMKILSDQASEARRAGGLGCGRLARILDAGSAASTGATTAALLRLLGTAVSPTSQHTAQMTGIVPPEHAATTARLAEAGAAGKTISSLTMEALTEEGVTGSERGKQRSLTQRLAKTRNAARLDDTQLQQGTRVRLGFAHGRGLDAAFTSRSKHERLHMDDQDLAGHACRGAGTRRHRGGAPM